jgi:ADP-heptose:LPS heptosyltransferase
MILISPFSKKLRNGMPKHPKDYPYWKKLVKLLKDNIIQIGIEGEKKLTKDFRKNLSLKEIEELVKECKYWISVDSFLPHLAKHIGKTGVVIWSVSDPEIFGYKENLNILKDRKYLRKNQFSIWEQESYNEDAFLKPEEIIKLIEEKCQI